MSESMEAEYQCGITPNENAQCLQVCPRIKNIEKLKRDTFIQFIIEEWPKKQMIILRDSVEELERTMSYAIFILSNHWPNKAGFWPNTGCGT